MDALVDKGGTLQDLVQPQMLPEASLLLPLPFFPPYPPSLSFPSSLPPKAGVPGGGTCQSLAVPLPLPAQGAAPPGSQVFGSQETLQAPGETVKLRTPQTPLRSHGHPESHLPDLPSAPQDGLNEAAGQMDKLNAKVMSFL